MAIHTARWYDYISTLDCCFPPLPLPPPTAAAFSQCISLPPPPLPPSTAAASPHRCCAPPSPLRPPIPAAFPLSYCVPSSLLPFVTGSGPPYQGSDPHNCYPFLPLVLPPPPLVLPTPTGRRSHSGDRSHGMVWQGHLGQEREGGGSPHQRRWSPTPGRNDEQRQQRPAAVVVALACVGRRAAAVVHGRHAWRGSVDGPSLSNAQPNGINGCVSSKMILAPFQSSEISGDSKSP